LVGTYTTGGTWYYLAFLEYTSQEVIVVLPYAGHSIL
jgi:hypothetical protein